MVFEMWNETHERSINNTSPPYYVNMKGGRQYKSDDNQETPMNMCTALTDAFIRSVSAAAAGWKIHTGSDVRKKFSR